MSKQNKKCDYCGCDLPETYVHTYDEFNWDKGWTYCSKECAYTHRKEMQRERKSEILNDKWRDVYSGVMGMIDIINELTDDEDKTIELMDEEVPYLMNSLEFLNKLIKKGKTIE